RRHAVAGRQRNDQFTIYIVEHVWHHDGAATWIACLCGDNAFDLILGVNRSGIHLDGKGKCGGLNGRQEVLERHGCCWIEQQLDTHRARSDLLQQFYPFPAQCAGRAMKPVMLPPGCARFAAKPLPIGSDTPANTIGIVFVKRARAWITGGVTAKIALGRRSTSSFAKALILSGSSALQRSSTRRLLPSVHPSFESAPRKVASQDCAARSLCA